MDDNFETSIKNTILEVSCDEIPPCTPPNDKYLESWVPYDIFETHLFEEDCLEQNEKCRQGLDTSDEASLISDIDPRSHLSHFPKWGDSFRKVSNAGVQSADNNADVLLKMDQFN